jgi:catechol 2,3-dioxygenase-like lactoylglutathione lyase family enzyme
MPTPPAVAVLGIDHIVLRVRDVARMTKFYGDVLGCRIEKVQDKLGLTHLRAGSALIDLISLDGPLGTERGAAPGREGRNMDHVCLRVATFDAPALKAHLAAHGVTLLGAVGSRFGADGDGPSLYITDPEGNVVELKGPPGPVPAES